MPTAFTDPLYLSITPLTGCNPLHYFLHPLNPLVPPFMRSHLGGQKSQNEVLFDQGSDDWTQMSKDLKKMPGYQYNLDCPNNTMTLFVITLLNRGKVNPKRDYKVIKSWYIDHGVIYECPRVKDVEGVMLGKRIRSLENVREQLETRYGSTRNTKAQKKAVTLTGVEGKIVERVWGRMAERISKSNRDKEPKEDDQAEDDETTKEVNIE